MALPQTGIFALGTAAHSYLEMQLRPGTDPGAAVAGAANLTEPRTTMGGVNLVIGFRPELWRSVQPDHAPTTLTGFNTAVVGRDGYEMPATQRDLVFWTSGAAQDVVFDAVTGVIAALHGTAEVVEETLGWTYHHDLDLTGFVDGTENPPLAEAPQLVLVSANRPGQGGSVLLLQRWLHEAGTWTALSVEQQEQVIGRTKADSVELDDKPDSSHVARTDQEVFGKIFRRNTPYGSSVEHGTMFVGFAAHQRPLAKMLDSMAGVDGDRDALTRYARPLTGAYYFVPSLEALSAAAA